LVLGSEDLEVREMDLELFKNEHNQLSATFKNIIEHLAICISVTTMRASDLYKKSVRKKTDKT
ncbi:MAG: hypothetical protein KKE59_00630, partial [Proteobacteria bacterium]|nr:hypothetical protein [Pseudomonadota bacterium]